MLKEHDRYKGGTHAKDHIRVPGCYLRPGRGSKARRPQAGLRRVVVSTMLRSWTGAIRPPSKGMWARNWRVETGVQTRVKPSRRNPWAGCRAVDVHASRRVTDAHCAEAIARTSSREIGRAGLPGRLDHQTWRLTWVPAAGRSATCGRRRCGVHSLPQSERVKLQLLHADGVRPGLAARQLAR